MEHKGTAAVEEYVVANYGIKPALVEYIAEGVTNTNYLISTADKQYVFKIYNFKQKEQVQFEVNVLEALREHDFLSPQLLKRSDGKHLGEFLGKPCLLYCYIDGAIEKTWGTDILRQVGAYMGGMHMLLQDFSDTSKSETFDLEATKALVRGGERRFKDAQFPEAEELLSFVETCLAGMSFPDELPKGVTHHDVKPENVILRGGKLAGVIDFDLTYYGVLLNDIATTIIWSCFNGDSIDIEKAQAFLDGYESKRLLTNIEQKYFADILYYRLVREVFSSPFDVLPNFIEITKERSDEFRRRAELFKKNKDSIQFTFKN